MLTLDMSKKRKKGMSKKTSHSEFLLQLIYFMKSFWLNKENVHPLLADRLQQFTHFPLIQTSLSSEKERVRIFFKYKKNNSSLKKI